MALSKPATAEDWFRLLKTIVRIEIGGWVLFLTVALWLYPEEDYDAVELELLGTTPVDELLVPFVAFLVVLVTRMFLIFRGIIKWAKIIYSIEFFCTLILILMLGPAVYLPIDGIAGQIIACLFGAQGLILFFSPISNHDFRAAKGAPALGGDEG